MADDLALTFKNALIDLLGPLEEAASDPGALAEWLTALGQTPAMTSDPALLQIVKNAASLVEQLRAFDSSALTSFAGIAATLAIGEKIADLQSQLQQFASDPSRSQAAQGFAEEVMALLLASYLRRRFPITFRVGSVLTVIDARESGTLDAALLAGGTTARYPRVLDRFDFDALTRLISQPAAVLQSAYFPNQLTSAADAWAAGARLFGDLSFLADELGLAWRMDYQSSAATAAPEAPGTDGSPSFDGEADGTNDDGTAQGDYGWIEPVSDDGTDEGSDDTGDGPADAQGADGNDGDGGADTVAVVAEPLPDSYFASYFPGFRVGILTSATDPRTAIAIEVQCSSASHPGATPGYIVSLVGTFDAVTTFGSWRMTLTSNGQIPAFILRSGGFGLVPTAVPLAGGAARMLLEHVAPAGAGPTFLVGSANGTRLEIGAAQIALDVSYDPADIAAATSIKATHCSFVIKPSDGDDFLSSVLPADGLHADFDLGLTYSSTGGLSFQGAAGLDATLPIGLSIGGVVTIPSLHLALAANGGGLQAEVSAGISFSIGPIEAVVDRLGMTAALTFPAGGGNFGLADIGLNFKPPSGVGLTVDAAGVSGGGFLGHDDAKQEYNGVLQLQFTNLALQAFGLITTQVAGGSGYSLLALVDAEFPPIQLGWGFTLNGVGGILAVNRTVDVDALGAALKADKLSAILFPKNAITNAAQIMGQLDALFPTAQGRFIFGPMALIEWGTPTLLTIALAIVLELPEPIRIILLARVAARLPSESKAVVRINVDALGVLDLSQGQLALDATLYDSRILTFTLSGDLSLRANWGTQREFVLAIGGFHPQFTPPPGFPSLKRITIDMPSGSISKMRLAAYLAITSNTVQFGADLDVFIGVSGFGLAGHLAFDALLQLDPFHFAADISGSVALKAGGDDLMSIELDASLSGPGLWTIAGSFKVHIIFFDVHKSFTYSWGNDVGSQTIPPIDVLGLLTAAFADARNWGVQLPADLPALVSLRSTGGSSVIAHPLAQIDVHESVVPLGLQIERIGSAPVSGATLFAISDFQINGTSVAHQAVQEDFAPAQFFNLTDIEKLARPSFEAHAAGAATGAVPVAAGAPLIKSIGYETSYIDAPGAVPRSDPAPSTGLFLTDLTAVMSFGASARAATRRAGALRYRAPGKPISIVPQRFVVANTSALTPAGIGTAAGATFSDAAALVTAAVSAAPERAGQVQIVPAYQLAVA